MDWIRLRRTSTRVRDRICSLFNISRAARTIGRTSGAAPSYLRCLILYYRYCFCSQVGWMVGGDGACWHDWRIASPIAAIGYSSTFGCSCRSHLQRTSDNIPVDEWKVALMRPIGLLSRLNKVFSFGRPVLRVARLSLVFLGSSLGTSTVE